LNRRFPAKRYRQPPLEAVYNSRCINHKKEPRVKALLLMITAAGALAAGLAYAQSGAEVVKAKGCLGCHEVDKKKVGPAFKDIAAKYKGNKDAEGNIVMGLKDGKMGDKAHPKAAGSDA
jgi:cytochrome c